MAEFPALPLFTDAYLADTRHLTAAQHGAYLLLLMMAWRTTDCCLPDDDEKLARWASMDKRAWQRNKADVMAFWRRNKSGMWEQGRLVDERKYVVDHSNKQSANARSRWLKTKETGDATAMPDLCQTDAPTPTPTPTPISDITNVISSISPREDENEKPKSRAKPKRRITTDWQPDQSCADACAQRGFNLETERAEFIDYWLSRGDARADWQATFRNWMRTKRSSAGGNTHGGAGSGSGPTSYERAVMAAYEQNIRQPPRSDTDWMRGPDGNPLED